MEPGSLLWVQSEIDTWAHVPDSSCVSTRHRQEFLSSNPSPLPALLSVWQYRKGSPMEVRATPSLLCRHPCTPLSSEGGAVPGELWLPTGSSRPSPWGGEEGAHLPTDFYHCSQWQELTSYSEVQRQCGTSQGHSARWKAGRRPAAPPPLSLCLCPSQQG